MTIPGHILTWEDEVFEEHPLYPSSNSVGVFACHLILKKMFSPSLKINKAHHEISIKYIQRSMALGD
jgi:hypothetical protein